MTERVLLTSEELQSFSARMPQWTVNVIAIERVFKFANFVEAFAFMTEVAKIAEELDHHPDWSNSWNTVEISITNHQAGGITEVDLYMCARIEETAKRWGK